VWGGGGVFGGWLWGWGLKLLSLTTRPQKKGRKNKDSMNETVPVRGIMERTQYLSIETRLGHVKGPRGKKNPGGKRY